MERERRLRREEEFGYLMGAAKDVEKMIEVGFYLRISHGRGQRRGEDDRDGGIFVFLFLM